MSQKKDSLIPTAAGCKHTDGDTWCAPCVGQWTRDCFAGLKMRETMIEALRYAIDYEESFMDAHSDQYAPGDLMKPTKGLEAPFRAAQKNVKRFKALRRLLRGQVDEEKSKEAKP